jgi:hypothetical protein
MVVLSVWRGRQERWIEPLGPTSMDGSYARSRYRNPVSEAVNQPVTASAELLTRPGFWPPAKLRKLA